MKKMGKKKWITIAIVVAVAIVGVVGYQAFVPKETKMTTYKTYNVAKKDLTVSIQGTGNIVSSNEKDVILTQSGEVKDLAVSEGDSVEAGQTMFTIYSETLQDSIDSTQDSISQQQISNSKLVKSLSDYKVYAPIDGYVYNLKAEVGDDASKIGSVYGGVCEIVPNTSVTLDCDLTYSAWNVTDRQLTINQTVYIRSRYASSDTAPTAARVSSVSGTDFTVEIPASFANVGTLCDVYSNTNTTVYYQLGEGTVKFVDPVKITGSGKIAKIYVKENQQVKKGDLLFEYDSSDVSGNLASASITLNNLKDDLAKNKEDLANNTVVAPISGIVSGLSAVEGGNVSEGSVVATIVSTDQQEIVIAVDELDVPKVAVGQTAAITVDALSDQEFTGKVTKIAQIGTVSNSITTYDVTIALDNATGIKVGMSATAEIVVEEEKGVIAIPVDYISNYGDKKRVRVIPSGVDVRNSKTWTGTDNGLAVPYEWREVTVGSATSDESLITSGLKDGDVIAIAEEKTTTTTGFSLFGGGGMPGGDHSGPPSGGGQGGPRSSGQSSGNSSNRNSSSSKSSSSGNKN